MSQPNKKSRHGGPRPGAGRKKGTKNPTTIQKEALLEEVIVRSVEGDTTPLEVMLQIMRDPQTPAMMKFEAAKAAAPYVHPRLSQVDSTVKHVQATDELTEAELVELLAGRRGSGVAGKEEGPPRPH